MFGLLGASTMIMPVLWMMFALPVLIYLVCRWRMANGSLPPDQQLGLKVVLETFGFVSYFVAIGGLVTIFWGAMLNEGARGDVVRAGLGLLVPGALVFPATRAARKLTNHAFAPAVARAFGGAVLLQVGLIWFMGLVFLSVKVFTPGSFGDEGKLAAAITLVLGVATVIQAMGFMRSGGALPPGGMPMVVPPPMVPPPAVPPPMVPPPAVPPPGGGHY